MSKDLQDDLNNIDLDYLDELSLGQAPDLKKSVSSPPPGFVNLFILIFLKNF